jgi:flagellar L-ring protein precursor FlgH
MSNFRHLIPIAICFLCFSMPLSALKPPKAKKDKPAEPTPLDIYIKDAMRNEHDPAKNPTGSIWSPGSNLVDLGSDLRASHVDDLVTVVVSEQASAVSTGTTKTGRTSSLQASVSSLGGVKSATGALANLAKSSTDAQLNGQGSTGRTTTLTTTISARVTHVLPNGYLVIEGHKDTMINSERETVTVRGVVRPPDLSAENSVTSDRLAELEVRINGKGVVGDSIRRPNILYRVLMGILPF